MLQGLMANTKVHEPVYKRKIMTRRVGWRHYVYLVSSHL